ncbi:hypothetical protein EEL32_10190 [Brevibacillus laterosporus]|nr:hypothetical protein [Brevibacillus laterosporus]TPG88125.1 hypothetical protein EEL32_10190 [Brevibacillus laterosporus]
MDTFETIVHEGKLYRKVDRRVKKGDRYVTPKKNRFNADLTKGKVYELQKDEWEGYSSAITPMTQGTFP